MNRTNNSSDQKNPCFYDAVSDFIFMEDEPRPCDVIFVPGNNLPDLAFKAAQLYREGYAKYVLPSGKYSKLVGEFRQNGQVQDEKTVPAEAFETEWAFMRGILLAEGVPDEAILKEDQATYTWQNAIFSRQVLEKKGLPFETAILCCQAYHARRAWMYYKQQFPETQILVVPVTTRGITRDNWYYSKEKTDVVLGEMSRIGEQFHCCLPLI